MFKVNAIYIHDTGCTENISWFTLPQNLSHTRHNKLIGLQHCDITTILYQRQNDATVIYENQLLNNLY